jgi:hypothetical protein
MASAVPEPDAELDCITLLQSIALHFHVAATVHTSTRTTRQPHVFKLASSNLY